MNTFLDKEGLSRYHKLLTGEGHVTSMQGYLITSVNQSDTSLTVNFDNNVCGVYDKICIAVMHYENGDEEIHFEAGDTISVKYGNNFNDWTKITGICYGETGYDVEISLERGIYLSEANLNSAPEGRVIYCNSKPTANPTISTVDIDSCQSAFGYYNQSSMYAAFSCNYNNRSIGRYSFTANQGNTAAHASFACGYNNKILAHYSFGTGEYNTIDHLARGSFVMGKSNKVYGLMSWSSGQENTVTGTRAWASGYQNKAEGSNASANGTDTVASGAMSTTYGTYTIASHQNEFVVGKYNNRNLNTLFSVGCGDDPDDTRRETALWVTQDGYSRISKYPLSYQDITHKGYVDNELSTVSTQVTNLDTRLTGIINGTKFNTISSTCYAVFGQENTVNTEAIRSIVNGYKNNISAGNSATFGGYNNNTHNFASLIGYNLTSTRNHSLVCGRCNNKTTPVLFAVGDGNDTASTGRAYHNAFEVITEGDFSSTPAYCRVGQDPIHPLGVATKQYVDNKFQVLESLPTTTNNDTIYFILEA